MGRTRTRSMPMVVAFAISLVVVATLFAGFAAWSASKLVPAEKAVLSILNKRPVDLGTETQTVDVEPVIIIAPRDVSERGNWFERWFGRSDRKRV